MQDPKYKDILIDSDFHLSDSANHTVYFNLMKLVLGMEHKDVRYLYFDEVTGLGKRHPDRETTSFTRDQFIPFIAYQAFVKSLAVGIFYRKVLENNGFFFNSVTSSLEEKPWYDRDWLDPQTRALWARAYDKKRFMHYVGDLNIILTIIYKDLRERFNSKWRSDADENIHCHIIVSNLVRPTFITPFINWYYSKKTLRPWRTKLHGFFVRDGSYYPEIYPIAEMALSKIFNFS